MSSVALKKGKYARMRKKYWAKWSKMLMLTKLNMLNRHLFAGSILTLIFDYDKNKVTDSRTKKSYALKEILSGNTKVLESDLRV